MTRTGTVTPLRNLFAVSSSGDLERAGESPHTLPQTAYYSGAAPVSAISGQGSMHNSFYGTMYMQASGQKGRGTVRPTSPVPKSSGTARPTSPMHVDSFPKRRASMRGRTAPVVPARQMRSPVPQRNTPRGLQSEVHMGGYPSSPPMRAKSPLSARSHG